MLIAGLIVGIGVVELSCGPLGQTSRFSLELLILLVLQLVGPGVVALIAMALLMPRWLEASEQFDRRHDPSAAASGLVGAVLLLLFLPRRSSVGWWPAHAPIWWLNLRMRCAGCCCRI